MKNRGKSSSLSFLFVPFPPHCGSSLVSRDVNLINFLISQISSFEKFFCVISRVDLIEDENEKFVSVFHGFSVIFFLSKPRRRGSGTF